MDARKVLIFDTTLRDGEKVPGLVLSLNEKVRIAKQIVKLGVDVLEVGFPGASEGEFEAAKEIVATVSGPKLVCLARPTSKKDFEAAWKVLEKADNKGLHTFVPASDAYREHFLKKNREEVLKIGEEAISYAKKYTDDVEFSLVDTWRADPAYVVNLVQMAVDSGATSINFADTVGYATPREVADLVDRINTEVKGLDNITLSIHCHNDLGLAVANSLAAIEKGVNQVHCTVNGIGERAGNTALEEIVMILETRKDLYGCETSVDLGEIYPTCRMISQITGVLIPPGKPIVGANAFIYETVVPQVADVKEKPPYEVIDPDELGIKKEPELLKKDATKEELGEKLAELGLSLNPEELDRAYEAFKELAERKETVFDEDIESLVVEEVLKVPARYKLLYLSVSAGSISVPNATVQMEVDGQIIQDAAFGRGPVDATFKTIQKIVKRKPKLTRYLVNAITAGTDALGEVVVGLQEDDLIVMGRGIDSDVVMASAKAFVNGLNKMELYRKAPPVSEFTEEEVFAPIL